MARQLRVTPTKLYAFAVGRFPDGQDEALIRAALGTVYRTESSVLPAEAEAIQAVVASEGSDPWTDGHNQRDI